MICDWWVSIRFVGFFVSRLVACDRNKYWRPRKTQLWRRLLNFRVRVFVNSAVCTLFVLLKQKLVLGANMSSCQTPGSKLYSGIDISLGNAHKRASPWVNNNENHFQVESTVVMWETLAINLFGWLTYFKSILTSLQALQCILCLSHIRHSFIWTTPPLRQNQILGATWLAATRVFYQDKRENTGNDVACSNNLCSVYSYRQELYEIQNFIN